MTKEELLKEIMKLPKIETDNPICTMNGINVDELMSAIDRLNKIPDYNDLLKENKQLKDELKSNPDTQITLQDNKGNKFMVIQTERINMQEELNKTIQRLFDNWNKLKEYVNENLYFYSGLQGEDLETDFSMQLILNKIQELEQESESE